MTITIVTSETNVSGRYAVAVSIQDEQLNPLDKYIGSAPGDVEAARCGLTYASAYLAGVRLNGTGELAGIDS